MATTFAGKPVTGLQLRTTIDFLKRLSQTDRPLAAWHIHVAINRKAGIPDVACRNQESDRVWAMRRDASRLRKIRHERVRVYQFETREVRRRFAHLLNSYDD